MAVDIKLTKGERVICITPPKKNIDLEGDIKFVSFRLYRRQKDTSDAKYTNLMTSFKDPEIRLLVYSEIFRRNRNDHSKFYQQARWLTQKQFEECFMVV